MYLFALCACVCLPAPFLPLLALSHSAQVILHDFKCKPVFDLGSGPYNVARWNPFGRFLAIAGFGNLPGMCGWVGGWRGRGQNERM